MKPFMEWSDNLNTGIDTIDLQHRKIVDYINELHGAEQQEDSESVGEILNKLIDYTIYHFSFEEKLLENNRYKALEEHKILHQQFIQRIKKHQSNHNNGARVIKALTGELQVWLITHISKEDQRYVPSVTTPLEGNIISRMFKKFFG